MKEFTGRLSGSSGGIAVVVSRFNELITENLLKGALDALNRLGVDEKKITVARVPGAFEIPLIARQLAFSRKYDAVICLGAVIRGATPHFDYVAGQTSAGIAQAALDSGIPIIFGVLTTDTVEQALERAGTKSGNKGYEAAMNAVEMIDLMNQIGKPTPRAHDNGKS